jgi:hypothetical protein
MARLESDFRSRVLSDILQEYPRAVILQVEGQGKSDRLILHERNWAFLEFKRSAKAPKQPNQEHYVDLFNEMSFARFIYPENELEVLRELDYTLRAS